MPRIMLDLETLGIDYGCPIFQLGYAVFVDLSEAAAKSFSDDFPANCILGSGSFTYSIKTCLDRNMRVDAQTLAWWMKQKGTGRDVLMSALQGGENIVDLCGHLQGVWSGYRASHGPINEVWAHGSTFDIGHLAYLTQRLGQELPFARLYRNIRDTRTLFAYADNAGVEYWPKDRGDAHNAEQDCIAQAKAVILAEKGLKL